MIIASSAIALAAVPLLTVLLLFGIVAFVLNRRAAQIDKARKEGAALHARLVAKDQELEHAFLRSLLKGNVLEECVPPYLKKREAILPGSTPDQPGHWNPEHLDEVCQRRFIEEREGANRRATFQASVAALTLVGSCVVMMAVLYGTMPSRDSAGAQLNGTRGNAVFAPQSDADPHGFEEFAPLSSMSPSLGTKSAPAATQSGPMAPATGADSAEPVEGKPSVGETNKPLRPDVVPQSPSHSPSPLDT